MSLSSQMEGFVVLKTMKVNLIMATIIIISRVQQSVYMPAT